MIMIAFITLNNTLVPLIERLSVTKKSYINPLVKRLSKSVSAVWNPNRSSKWRDDESHDAKDRHRECATAPAQLRRTRLQDLCVCRRSPDSTLQIIFNLLQISAIHTGAKTLCRIRISLLPQILLGQIPELMQALYKSHPQPPNMVPRSSTSDPPKRQHWRHVRASSTNTRGSQGERKGEGATHERFGNWKKRPPDNKVN